MNMYPGFIEKQVWDKLSVLSAVFYHCYYPTLKCLGGILVGHWQGCMLPLHLKCKLLLHLLVPPNSAAKSAVN